MHQHLLIFNNLCGKFGRTKKEKRGGRGKKVRGVHQTRRQTVLDTNYRSQ